MDYFEIEGGFPLSGEISVNGNKNEALPVLSAVILTEEEIHIKNLPNIKDVLYMIEILKSLGTDVKKISDNEYKFKAANIKDIQINRDLAEKIRGSLLFAGSLIARFGEAIIPVPGGDKIGRRRVDTHLLALSKLGVNIELSESFEIIFKQESNHLSEEVYIFLDEASVTGTENILLCASTFIGTVEIYNAACEPHVQNLCHLLVKMGVSIQGIGTNKLKVTGKKRLNGCQHQIGPDHIEIGSYISLAAATKSELVIRNVQKEYLHKINHTFEQLGVLYSVYDNQIVIDNGQQLRIKKDFGGAVPKIDDGPWPAFPADLTSVMAVLATQCYGTVLIFEKMFEARLFFVDRLIAMGANIVLCDPHRAVINGPTPLHGIDLSSPDIRAGMALLIASLSAKGKSKIFNIFQIDRGYEKIDERLCALGAKIKRVSV